ncbi:MAG: lipopolysaccharide heptosyltransferase I [Endozoicomonas sp. (ex Botrylloides leachii)]|nr:lipopolysaccharide heptosyltransferase I [Endozoicomonas sp. (ex Botrylloides leachii)]
MKVLLIKMSSMGDIIHTLPALTDAVSAIPNITFDWVVEEAFAEIPAWHPAVDNIIPVAIRRWRKSPFDALTNGEWFRFKKRLQAKQYDAVIDAQGLIKSAFLAKLARGFSHGLDKYSAREPIATHFYQNKYRVCWDQHAVERIRQLMAQALGYHVPDHKGLFSLNLSSLPHDSPIKQPYIIFIHGTTWVDKHWPDPYWCRLANYANAAGFKVLLPWGNNKEKQRAEHIAQASRDIEVLAKMNLSSLAKILSRATGVVAVDTGLGHLAAALGKPSVSLYGPTSPERIGSYGINQIHLTTNRCPSGHFPAVKPAIFAAMTPEYVWDSLKTILPV